MVEAEERSKLGVLECFSRAFRHAGLAAGHRPAVRAGWRGADAKYWLAEASGFIKNRRRR
jgi:hypothetical protein